MLWTDGDDLSVFRIGLTSANSAVVIRVFIGLIFIEVFYLNLVDSISLGSVIHFASVGGKREIFRFIYGVRRDFFLPPVQTCHRFRGKKVKRS